jgi:hypothetical protein
MVAPPAAAAVMVSVLALVAVLYLLRPPARRVLVPSNLIWERLLRGFHRRDERLRWWLSLLLAALIAALLTYSLLSSGSPAAAGGGQLVIVVDNSPTMGARTTDGVSRFERAKRRAAELISSLHPGQRVLLADTMRAISLPSLETASAALARLERLQVSAGRDPAVPAVARAVNAEAVHILTDGVLLRDLVPRARIESTFEAVDNVGISRFEVSSVPGDVLRRQAFAEIQNGGSVTVQVELSLLGADGRRIVRQLSVPAQGTVAQTLDVSGFQGGGLRAVVAASGDGLALDDVAYAYLPARKMVRVTLVTDGNAYLEKSLSVLPRVRLSRVRPAEFTDRGEADAYVFDRYTPTVGPSAPALLIKPGPASWLPLPGVEVLRPGIARWNAAHPLLKGLSLRDLRVDAALPPSLGAAAAPGVVLLGTGGEPLLVARDGPLRWILVAFSLDETNFALHSGFPIFLGNALNWLSDEPVIGDARLGEVEVQLRSARVFALDGSDVAVRSAGPATRFEALEPGIYTAVSADARLKVVVNGFDSRLIQVNHSLLPATATRQQPAYPAAIDSWLWLIAGALLLLLLEWVTYSRRLTI